MDRNKVIKSFKKLQNLAADLGPALALLIKKYDEIRGGQTNFMSPGLVVMEGDSCSKGCEFESRYHILDGHISH